MMNNHLLYAIIMNNDLKIMNTTTKIPWNNEYHN